MKTKIKAEAETKDLITTEGINIVLNMSEQPNNPLHGIKLQQIVEDLEAHYGWEYMGHMIKIRCFTHDPSVKSSLKFLRRTPWARQKVEEMYLGMLENRR